MFFGKPLQVNFLCMERIILENSQAVMIFLFVTETQYIFHIQFYIPAYIGCILFLERLYKMVVSYFGLREKITKRYL